jgi:hypothetical protein
VNISIILLITGAALVIAGLVVLFLLRGRFTRQLKTDYFQEQWQALQKLLSDKAKWAEAILDADQLLDEALKKRRFRGRSMGERLVKAQRLFSDNDGVWFGHKLRNKIDADPTTKLKKAEVQQALLGIRQALKDLGALPSGSKTDS